MSQDVRAEMSASVWKVVAAPGDRVTALDPLVILESMKMEIPVHPDGEGTVTEICVAEGDSVSEGDVIARVE